MDPKLKIGQQALTELFLKGSRNKDSRLRDGKICLT